MNKWMYVMPLLAVSAPVLAEEPVTATPMQAQVPMTQEAPVMAAPQPSPLDIDIASLQDDWAVIKYQTPSEDQQDKAIEALADKAAGIVQKYPGRAEPLIWQGIILGTKAGMDGPFSAMGDARAARDALEQAEKINATALNGSVYTSLGSLYYKVPGFPIGFGDNKKARMYLEKAVSMNPNGIDSNFFYGEFLADQGEYARAEEVLNHALQAPQRPGRELADKGRAEEIRNLLADIAKKKGS